MLRRRVRSCRRQGRPCPPTTPPGRPSLVLKSRLCDWNLMACSKGRSPSQSTLSIGDPKTTADRSCFSGKMGTCERNSHQATPGDAVIPFGPHQGIFGLCQDRAIHGSDRPIEQALCKPPIPGSIKGWRIQRSLHSPSQFLSRQTETPTKGRGKASAGC